PNPAMPPPAIVRFGLRTAAQKIGIKPEMSVAVMNAPLDYEALLGDMPEGVELVEESPRPLPITLWFTHDFDGLLSDLDAMRRLAPRTRLWIVWQKGTNNGVTFNSIMTVGREIGLALSKLCAVNESWAAVWLTPKRIRK